MRRRLLAVADAATAISASATLAFVGAGVGVAVTAALLLPVWILLAKLHGLYDRDHRSLRHLTVDEAPMIAMWSLVSVLTTGVILSFTNLTFLSVGVLSRVAVVATCAGFTFRGLARGMWRRLTPPERAVIIGSGPIADATRRKLELFPEMHVDAAHANQDVLDEETLEELLIGVERVIVAVQTIDEHLIARLVDTCRRKAIKLSIVPPVRGMFGTAVQLTHIAELPVLEYNTWDVSRSTMMLKRCMDLLVAIPTLVLISPLCALIAVAIKLESRGPVIFAQQRGGIGGEPFRMLKFRTMVSNAEDMLADLVSFDLLKDPMFKLERDPRVSRVGRLLRRTSLDELPQFLNIIRGDMSLVGPRPEQLDLVERYQPEHRFRLLVKPGLTGPMQVHGRGALTFSERLAVEREYIENLTLRRDLRILALTMSSVISGKGAF